MKSSEAEAASSATLSESVITYESGADSADLNLVVKDLNGTFMSSAASDLAKFAVTTNNYTGYTLTITGDNSGELKNGSASFSSVLIATDAETFTKGSANAYNGKWGYLPSKYNSAANTDYLPAPGTSGNTLDVTNSANTTANNYTIGLGARAGYDTPSGSYTNTFTLATVANAPVYTVTYADVSKDSSVTNLPSPSSGATSSSNINKISLSSTVPTRTNYTFTGWCSVEPTASSDGGSECSGGDSYSAGGDFFLDQTTANVTTLYATWKLTSVKITFVTSSATGIVLDGVTYTNGQSAMINVGSHTISGTFASRYTFSSWSSTANTIANSTFAVTTYTVSAAATLTLIGQQATVAIQNLSDASCTTAASVVYDNRDDQVYTIQRLADGNCWMMNNLNLGATTLSTDLTSSNTNLSTTITASTFNGWKKSSGSQTYTAGEFIPLTTANTSNGLDFDQTSGNYYGTLYNYYAASAGTISGSSNSNDATYDICPKGWRLPTGGSSGEFQALYNNSSYNTNTKMRASIANGGAAFALAGNLASGAPKLQGGGGRYWSASRYDATGMHYLYLDTSGVNSLYYSNRHNGYSIRCVLKSPYDKLISGELSMQDIGSLSISDKTSLLSKMSTGTAYTVYDNRDSQTYQIAKLADGNLWMADNLNLGATTLSTDLTSSNTNLSTTVSASTFNSWKKSSGSQTFTAGEFIPVSGSDSTSGTNYGTLYNYCAASANTYCYSANDSTDYGNAAYDICPKGWRLPTGGSSGEFQALYSNSSYNTNAKMRASIANGGAAFALAGDFTNAAPKNQGSYGYYWSSSRSSAAYMYYLALYTSNVQPVEVTNRYGGQSIRCVLKPTAISASSMQTVGTPNLYADGATGTLADSRDSQIYSVVKYNNLLWMTRNLAIGCNGSGSAYGSSVSSKTLTSANSNVNSSWSTPTLLLTDDNEKNSYDNAAIKCDSTYGAWYNYAAATAGTITGNSNSTEASSSICPSGWRLFASSERITETAFKDVFSPVYGGNYYDGTLDSASTGGYWWSSTASNTANRCFLYYGNGLLSTGSYGYRPSGYYVRCVRPAS